MTEAHLQLEVRLRSTRVLDAGHQNGLHQAADVHINADVIMFHFRTLRLKGNMGTAAG
jgi:hypothetical protein